MKIIAVKGNYQFCQYDSGLYTVDKVTKSVGMTIKASFDRTEVETFYNNLKVRKSKKIA